MSVPSTLFEQCVGSFMSHRVMNTEELWEGTHGLLSLSEKTRESNHLQMYRNYKGSTFYSVLLRP